MIAETAFDFLGPKIAFMPGGANTIGRRLTDRGAGSVLLCSDKGFSETGLLDQVISSLQKEGVAVSQFLDIESNPTIETIKNGYQRLKKDGCEAILAVGGGSVIDAAKALALLGTNPPPLSRYFGIGQASRASLPLIAVPTTAGTGSEVTWLAVITNSYTKKKLSIVGPTIMPDLALLDPHLLKTLPQKVIAESGMDALSHAIEAFVSRFNSPLSDGMALEAIHLISESLERFYHDPSDKPAAGRMLLASTMAGIAFGNARTAVAHAMAHALGGFYNIGHGVSCAVVLPVTMAFYKGAVPDRLSRIAAALGVKTDGFPEEYSAQKAIDTVRALSDRLQIPENLKELGVKPADFGILSENAMATGIQAATPREVGMADMHSLFEASWE